MPTCSKCGRAFSPAYAAKFPTAKVCGGCALEAMFRFLDSEDDDEPMGKPEDPVCFCGSSFSAHGQGSNHSPVAMYDED